MPQEIVSLAVDLTKLCKSCLPTCFLLLAELLRQTQNSKKHKNRGLCFLSRNIICFCYPLPTQTKDSFFFSVSFKSRVKAMSWFTRLFHQAYVKLYQEKMCPYCYWHGALTDRALTLLPKCLYNWMSSMWALQEKEKVIWVSEQMSREWVLPFWFCPGKVKCGKVVQTPCQLTVEEIYWWTLESVHFGRANNGDKRRWIYHYQVLRAVLCLEHFFANKINSSIIFVI